MIFQRILVGLLLIGTGVVGLKYTFQIVGFTGRQDWIEYKLGSGSTYMAYKVIFILLALAGVLYLTGTAHFITDPIGNALQSVFRIQS